MRSGRTSTPNVIRLSSLTGMGELMKHGCTTCFDHHYVFPKDTGDLIGAQFGAADALGIRMYASRGSMDLSRQGRRPAAGQRGADGRRDHEGFRAASSSSTTTASLRRNAPRRAGALLAVLRLAPSCCVQSADPRPSATVCVCTPTCARRRMKKTSCSRAKGIRPLEYMERLGWTGDDVWFAHGIHFNDEELQRPCRRPARACATAPFPT